MLLFSSNCDKINPIVKLMQTMLSYQLLSCSTKRLRECLTKRRLSAILATLSHVMLGQYFNYYTIDLYFTKGGA